MPGKRPPSAIPSNARTATKLAKFCTNPKHMVIIPQTTVNNGNQIFGDAFLRMRLLGTSLYRVSFWYSRRMARNAPDNVCEIEHRQADIKLMICDIQIFFQTNNLSVPGICPIQK